MAVQWVAGIAAAVWISPRTWMGMSSRIHVHVWLAIFLGGAITSFPVFLAVTRPSQAFTRHVVAIGQMLMSALLIHLSGGRIETHFHVFGSLAFLAFYRDWRLLIPPRLRLRWTIFCAASTGRNRFMESCTPAPGGRSSTPPGSRSRMWF